MEELQKELERFRIAAEQLPQMKALNKSLKERLRVLKEETSLPHMLEMEILRARTFQYDLFLVSGKIDKYELIAGNMAENRLRQLRLLIQKVMEENLEKLDTVKMESEGRYFMILAGVTGENVRELIEYLREKVLLGTRNEENVIFTLSYGVAKLEAEDDATSLLERSTAALAEIDGNERNQLGGI